MNKLITLFAIVLAVTLAVGEQVRPYGARGSAKMVGTWGRNSLILMMPKTQAETIKVANAQYYEYVFQADGTFSENGAFWGSPVTEAGYYRLDDDATLHLWTTSRLIDGKRTALQPTEYVSKLAVVSGFLSFDDLGKFMAKGFYWDKKEGRYRDSEGHYYSPGPAGTTTLPSLDDDAKIMAAIRAKYGPSVPFTISYIGSTNTYALTVYAGDFRKTRQEAVRWLKAQPFYRQGSAVTSSDKTDGSGHIGP